MQFSRGWGKVQQLDLKLQWEKKIDDEKTYDVTEQFEREWKVYVDNKAQYASIVSCGQIPKSGQPPWIKVLYLKNFFAKVPKY